ncbi:MAG: class I SAM-dependent methyltransferase [Bacteroidales bacterium]|nr:class I SAM-dependent methyltransferase [Bacteroidales bacterium]
MDKPKYIHDPQIHNTSAAQEIVPQLIKWFNPKSVIDVGCGLGTWLAIFKQHGVGTVFGIEGNHINKDLLIIDESELFIADLENGFEVNRKFDLAISLEVAEHLSPEAADSFVNALTRLSDYIVFSAAIPGQGGQNHINEQWLDYWQSKFNDKGFLGFDEIRPIFWNNPKVEWWYKQNMVIFIKQDKHSPFIHDKNLLNLVHPEMFSEKMQIMNQLEKDIIILTESLQNCDKENIKFLQQNLKLKQELCSAELNANILTHSVSPELKNTSTKTLKQVYDFIVRKIFRAHDRI